MDEARPRDEKGEREGQDRVVRGKGPPRRDSRRGGARLYSLLQRVQGFQVSRRDGEIRLYGKVRTPRDSEVRFHLVERGGTGKSVER